MSNIFIVKSEDDEKAVINMIKKAKGKKGQKGPGPLWGTKQTRSLLSFFCHKLLQK